MRIEPILKLKDEVIKSLFLDEKTGSVLIGTSQGRILLAESLGSNAYMAGNRTIYSTRTNGMGVESPTSHVNIRYGLVDKIVELTSGFSISRWKDVISPFGAESYQTVTGTLTTPVLWAGEDFGWWGDASWTQSVSEGSRVVISSRVAGSSESLMASDWTSTESKISGSASMPMGAMSTAGSYAQMRVELTSTSQSENPSVSNLVLPYHSKHASYFFVTKISMKKGSSIQGGLMTAAVSVPKNTEVKWGVTGGNSFDWNDYFSVTPDKLFTLPADFGDRIKVGVKLLSYDDERYPSVDEFAVSFNAEINNLLGS